MHGAQHADNADNIIQKMIKYMFRLSYNCNGQITHVPRNRLRLRQAMVLIVE